MTRFWKEILVCAFLLLLTCLPYAQVLNHDFVNFDDETYVKHNLNIPGGLSYDNVWWAFTENRKSSHWHPLTWLSLLLDYECHGLSPQGYHFTNLLLHAANVLLLYALLRQGTGLVWPSAVVAGLFGVHPLHVESVAWISERKDVLSTFFWLLTTLAYFAYCRKPQRDMYLLVCIGCALGLLSKPMVVTLPFTLLLWDYWPLGRFAGRFCEPTLNIIREKVPLFVLATGSAVVTVVAMGNSGKLRSLETMSFSDRLANVLTAYVVYLRKMIWPSDLAAFYPLESQPYSWMQILGSVLVLAGITLFALLQMRRQPYLLMGWCWYLGTLVPVIGLVQVGSQAMADRYTYVPLIGIFVVVVWGSVDLARVWRCDWVLFPIWSVVLMACGWTTYFQAAVWKNSVALWEHTLAVTKNNYLAHTNLAMAHQAQDQWPEAIAHFEAALAVLPLLAAAEPAYRNLGNAYQKGGRFKEAVEVWRQMVQRWPLEARYRFELANSLRSLGQNEDADRVEAERP